jgi:hypothetical protein
MTHVLETSLHAHPSTGSGHIEGVRVRLERLGAGRLHLRFQIDAPADRIVLPPAAPPLRSDRLWETTCFEMFLKGATHPGYREFNFSPSGQWSAYEFGAYRAGMVQAAVAASPVLRLAVEPHRIAADIGLTLDLSDEPYRVGLCAIVEEKEYKRTFWAASHGASEPDFHHRSCFADDLPPPPGP